MKLLPSTLLLGALLGGALVHAVRFDLTAFPAHYNEETCLSQWAAKGSKVKVKARATPGYNQKIQLRVFDASASSNIYATRQDLEDKQVIEFTAHENAEVSACFRNILDNGIAPDARFRTITYSMDVGASAVDYAAMATDEKIKPIEAEMRKLEAYLEEVDEQIAYMKRRESKLRNTNESTNERVKFLSILSLIIIAAAGVWQVFYLRHFFRQKKLI
ncbi:vesicle coat component [Dimargaris xerosporica]|nr:vesicle coat component [Dimargaris xerosporica]